jgi:competence protein ComEC
MPRRLFISLLASLLVLAFALPVHSSGNGSAQISYIDVAQGDSALVQDPSGFDVLIDGGPTEAGPAVVDYIRTHSDKTIDVLLISHPHEDHIGGLLDVLQANDITITQILYAYPGSTQTWTNLVALANARSIPMTVTTFPAVLHWGQFDAYILNPAPGLTDPDPNDSSLVARIDYNQTRFLFPGDISATAEATVVARQTPVASDVLKVAHHGSAYSSSQTFLSAVQPTAGVISVGTGNTYGHPAGSTLARLAADNIRVWRTDQSGTVLMTSDGLSVTFPTQDLSVKVFLPLVQRQLADTPIPPPSGQNVVCNTSGSAQICAWVSAAAPAQYASVTVYGRLLLSNVAQNGQPMTAVWHYKSSTPSCSATTDASGQAACARSIGAATKGFQVNLDVSIAGYTAATWFVPQ